MARHHPVKSPAPALALTVRGAQLPRHNASTSVARTTRTASATQAIKTRLAEDEDLRSERRSVESERYGDPLDVVDVERGSRIGGLVSDLQQALRSAGRERADETAPGNGVLVDHVECVLESRVRAETGGGAKRVDREAVVMRPARWARTEVAGAPARVVDLDPSVGTIPSPTAVVHGAMSSTTSA